MGKISSYPNGASVAILDQYGNVIADTVGHSLVFTTIDHYLIHRGLMFIGSDTTSVTGTTDYDFILVNTSANSVHLSSFHFTSTQANATITMYKNVTTSTNGTAIPLNNMNFASANTSTANLYHSPTGLSLVGSTQIMHMRLIGNKQEGGTIDSGERELVLKQNEKILFRYSNLSASTDNMDFEFYTLDVGAM